MSSLPQNSRLVILFADISNSSALYSELGDEQARQLVANCLNRLAQQVVSHQGTLIKTIGDEIMCSFPLPVSALQAAMAMQTAVASKLMDGEHPLSIRIGFHYGEVICEAGDIYGDTVNVAARVVAITRAHQILITRAVAEALPPEFRNKVRQIMRAEFRGKQEALDIFQVTRDDEDTTITRIGLSKSRKPSEARNELLLRYNQQVVAVNDKLKSVVLGRGDNCGIVILNNFASRQHARLEFNFGKFILADHSANGTYVRFNDNHVIHLSHQEIILHGAGSISLGQAFSDNPRELIEFIVQ